MGIKEEIIEEFFEGLERVEDFPKKILNDLRNLWMRGQIGSKEKIHDIIVKGCEDDNNS